MPSPNAAFLQARDLLLQHRTDYDRAYREFRWPKLERFNWAFDHFDALAAGNTRPGLWLVEEDGTQQKRTFEELAERSRQVANFLQAQGLKRGDRVLMMLPNTPALWELMLGCIRMGAVVGPATTQLTKADLQDRIDRGRMKLVVTDGPNRAKFDELAGHFGKVLVGDDAPGWTSWSKSREASASFADDGQTRADDPMLLYFTSGTTAKPKLVMHTHQSYPVGHLTTMYWIGLQPGDVHWNISSPGWAKHAWSNVFAPWNAGATVFLYNYARFQGGKVLDALEQFPVTTLCAPPTVWRMLILEDLSKRKTKLRELVSAGEPLNPEVIERVRAGWSLTVRDGYGQTETTAQIGNTPGQPLIEGSMGRALPGYQVALLDADGNAGDEGEISLVLNPRPTGLMVGYQDDPELTNHVMRGGHYHTGDVASRDGKGYLTYVGRADDVFKASDYRISPFELESVLIEHEAVAEAALIPSPDPVRLAVPKAFVVLKPGFTPDADTARSIFKFTREKLAPYKRIRRLEFSDLPKTISGKIRRVELRKQEIELRKRDARNPNEFWDSDFPELR